MPQHSDTRGFLHIATGEQYLAEAFRSAESLRRSMPEANIALFTKGSAQNTDLPGPYSKVYELEEVHYSCLDKMVPLLDTPYEKTIFLDTDTYVCDSVEEIFDVLDRFDIAAAHAPYRVQYPLPEVPEAFPELNTGLIAFRRSEKAFAVFRKWPGHYREQMNSDRKPRHDQHAFRKALYESDAHFLVLPPEYNFRTIFPGFVGKGNPVKVLHGRQPNLDKIAERINQTEDIRLTVLHPFRVFSKDVLPMANTGEYLSELIFLNLPQPLQRMLSRFRHHVWNRLWSG